MNMRFRGLMDRLRRRKHEPPAPEPVAVPKATPKPALTDDELESVVASFRRTLTKVAAEARQHHQSAPPCAICSKPSNVGMALAERLPGSVSFCDECARAVNVMLERYVKTHPGPAPEIIYSTHQLGETEH